MPGERRRHAAVRAVKGSSATASGVAVKRASPLVPALAAAVGAGVVAGGVVLLTRPGGGPDPSSVVRDYYAAVRVGDCAAQVELIDTDGRPGEPDRAGSVASCRRAFTDDPGLGSVDLHAARLVRLEGDRATVRAERADPVSGEVTETEEVRLVRIDGDWRIDLAGSDPDAAGGERGS